MYHFDLYTTVMVKAHDAFGDFAGASRPFRCEADIEDLEIVGDIPRDLDGTFYRVRVCLNV